MKEISISDFARDPNAARGTLKSEPVLITDAGSDIGILISWEMYNAFRRGEGRVAYTIADTPDELLEELEKGCRDILGE